MYAHGSILTVDNFLLSFKSIESIKLEDISEDRTISTLKGDICLIVRTTGGFEYKISMLHLKQTGWAHMTTEELAKDIVESWKLIQSRK